MIIEDIVDTANTIKCIREEIERRGAKEIKLSSLLSKPNMHKYPTTIDYLGFEIPDKFVVGYGLDYNGLGRNLDRIYQLKQ